ncbi:hypothetical protein STCU_11634 [Strigomonas culicis]|uniref:Uncharacterized protein n=1 Tax=Strigomonas culicis TaxID=28005 RepID=S9TD86_9TRYP|nr:hypothetical protein STCU_11634 [Strigomonas culicis]|eukprot:EPY15982.1 hypothetical protein STCU_11634 [Strigomonas culicis]
MKPVPNSAVTLSAAAAAASAPASTAPAPPARRATAEAATAASAGPRDTNVVQLRIRVDLTVARVAYGMLAGKALCSPTVGYVEVAVPTRDADPFFATAAPPAVAAGKRARSAETTPETATLMACYQPQEGCLLAGEAVMVVAEPGALCAIAVRVPRPSRGTFDLVDDEHLGKKQWKCVRFTKEEVAAASTS